MDCSTDGTERKRWQSSEGSVLLLSELASIHPQIASQYLKQMIELLGCKDTVEYGKLHNTIWQKVCSVVTYINVYSLCMVTIIYVIVARNN